MICTCCELEYFVCEQCDRRFNPRRGLNRFCSPGCARRAAQARPLLRLGEFVQRGDDDACWLWQGPVSDNGYPKLSWKGGTAQGRRVVYESVRGPLPPHRAVRMRCGERLCVNPRHLRVMPQLPPVVALRRRKRELVLLPGLERWRELRGLSRRQLAAAAGIGHATVWRLELGYGAKPGTANLICQALGVNLDDLKERNDGRLVG